MNVGTDMQYAFTHAIQQHFVAAGESDSRSGVDKRIYDTRAWGTEGRGGDGLSRCVDGRSRLRRQDACVFALTTGLSRRRAFLLSRSCT